MDSADKLPSLYHLSHEVAALLDSDDPEALEALDALLPALEHKAANVVRWIEYTQDLVEAIRQREAKVIEARKAMETRLARSKDYLRDCLLSAEVYKITDSRTGTTIALQKNPPSAHVDDEGAVPDRFWVQPEPPPKRIDKKALLDALKGGPVPGAHIEQGMRLSIK